MSKKRRNHEPSFKAKVALINRPHWSSQLGNRDDFNQSSTLHH